MAGGAKQDEIVERIGLKILGGSFFMAWTRLPVRNHMSHFGYMFISTYFSREQRLKALGTLAMPRST